MWNDHQALNFLANILLTGVLLATFYVVGTRVMTLPFFALREVWVEGFDPAESKRAALLHVQRDQIEQVLNNSLNGNLMTVDLETIQHAFMELPWIRSVKIFRSWPPALNVQVEEQTAMARWGARALVNTNGEIFNAVTENSQLPIFHGPANSSQLIARQYTVFNKLLRPIEQKVTEIMLTPRHAWHVRLDTGIKLKLGREKIESRLKRYVAVYAQYGEHLYQQEDSVDMDLRYADGFAIRMP